MAICAADMKKCNKKAKCLFGPNEGEAYDPKDPCCGTGEFDSLKCDCIVNNGWVYNRQVATGFCYEFGSSGPQQICEGSTLVDQGRQYYGNYAQGDPTPTLAWEASTDWEVGGEKSGIISMGSSITAVLSTNVIATSDNTPWNMPSTTATPSGDSDACTLTFSNCGAVRLGSESASSVLYFDLLPYPADKAGYCGGLGDAECFSKAYDDYGPGGG